MNPLVDGIMNHSNATVLPHGHGFIFAYTLIDKYFASALQNGVLANPYR